MKTLAAYRLAPETLNKIKKIAQSDSQTQAKVIENAVSLYFVVSEAEKLKAIHPAIQKEKPSTASNAQERCL